MNKLKGGRKRCQTAKRLPYAIKKAESERQRQRLLDHYSKIAIASNKGEKNLHNEMLTVDECREYYSDTVKFPDDYPNLDDLRKIGLIERK